MAAANKKKPWKIGASSWYITNLKQSILETCNIYGTNHSNDAVFRDPKGLRVRVQLLKIPNK